MLKRLVQRSNGPRGLSDTDENEADVPPASAAPARKLLSIADSEGNAAVVAALSGVSHAAGATATGGGDLVARITWTTGAASFMPARTMRTFLLCRQCKAFRMELLYTGLRYTRARARARTHTHTHTRYSDSAIGVPCYMYVCMYMSLTMTKTNYMTST